MHSGNLSTKQPGGGCAQETSSLSNLEGGVLIKLGGALKKLHSEHSRRGGVNLSIAGCVQEAFQEASREGVNLSIGGCGKKISLGSLWATTTSPFLL